MDEATALYHDIDPNAEMESAHENIAWAVENGFTVEEAWHMFGNNLPGPRPQTAPLPDDLQPPDVPHARPAR